MWTSAASVPSGFCWVWVMRKSCPVRQSGFRVQYQGKGEICAERMAFLSCLIYPQIQAFAPLEQAHCIPVSSGSRWFLGFRNTACSSCPRPRVVSSCAAYSGALPALC